MNFSWPPARTLAAAALAGLIAAYWLSPHSSALIAVVVLYFLLVATP